MHNLEISVVEKARSTYHAHLEGTDAHHDFSFNFDLSDRQELQYIMAGISHGDFDVDFEARLKNYGDKLYNLLLSNGEAGKEFRKLRKDSLCLRLHLPPILELLPWEYLADEDDFLFKGIENFLIRVPSLEEKAGLRQKISPPVKVLVIISNPPDLREDRKLDVVREKRLIKDALRSLIDEGRIAVKWEDEASLERIHDVLLEFNPHIIHYTGHGGFDEEKEEGRLLLEDGWDKSLNVSGAKLAEFFAGRDVRLIVLSGCQTAISKATDSFSSVAGALVKKGIPSVIAMQQSIRDESANIFASRFYKALAGGQAVDAALGEARLSMAQRVSKENRSFIDWGIPVLISSARDLNLFAADAAAPLPAKPALKGFSKINLPNPGDIFVGRQKEQRQIARALRGGDARCIMVLGPGGIGKSSLAARAVEQSEEYFIAVLTIGCKTAPTAEQILLEINTFLMLNGNNMLSQVMQAPLELSQKIEYLPQVLNMARYLIIFDNFEDMLDITKEPHAIKDSIVRHLLETLVVNLRASRVLITSRLDFDFTRDRRYQSAILPVPLRELTKMEAFRLMENIPSLSNTNDEEKLLIYEKVGGNPFILDLVAAAARTVPVGNVLADIKNIQKEFVEKTLLDRLYEWLPDDETRKFFKRASVYRKPVNQDFLVKMGGDDERIGYLLHKSLLNRIAGDMYEMHTNTRNFGFELLEKIDGASGLRETQITAAQTYEHEGWENKNIDYLLESRWFYYSAAKYNKAGELVINYLTEPFHRWGYIDLVKGLNEETEKSTIGIVKAGALHNLGNVHYFQGRYDEAVEMYQKSLKISVELGDRLMIAGILHQIGMIHQDQGRYDEAVKMHQESMKIFEALGDKRGTAKTLHEMGNVHYLQGRYDEAVEMYQECMKISVELRDRRGIAKTMHNIGNVHYSQGRYDEAVKMYQECMKISEELRDRRGIASTLHQIGMIHQVQGRYDEAVKMYQKSMNIEEELGDRRGIANTLHQIGIIHQRQGRYDEAVKMYQESMKIKEELGDRIGMATALGQMGRILLAQKNYKEALRNFLLAFIIFDELKSPYKDLAKQDMMKLKEEIGEELFNKYHEEILANEQREESNN